MAALRRPLYILGAGAVTAAGLDAAQTCAAIRAGLSAFDETVRSEPFGAVQVVARIPAHWRLRRTADEWLVNLSARALLEALGTGDEPAEATVVFMVAPEHFREHPAYAEQPASQLLSRVFEAAGARFHAASRAFDGGAAAAIGLLPHAAERLEEANVQQVLLGAVDSLVNPVDLARLEKADRLKGEGNAQGLVPGEAAVFVRLGAAPEAGRTAGKITGVGIAREEDSALSDRYSRGEGMISALRAAAEGLEGGEPRVSFVVSTGNGERYSGWEEMIARSRFFRTRREILPTAYPAMTVGETGAAGAPLALMVAADSFMHDYAPGSVAMCEVASEGGLRAAAVVEAT